MKVPTIAIDASRLSATHRTGTERYSYEVIAALARLDQFHHYVLYTNGIPADLPPLGANVRLRNIPLRRLWTHARLGPTTLIEQPDVLFVPAHVVPLVAARPSVVTIHDLGYLAFPEAHTARRRLELDLTTRWSLRAAQQVIAISQATRADLIRTYGADPSRIQVVHHGLSTAFQPVDDPAQVAATCARYNLLVPGTNQIRPYLLYLGTIQPRKNLVRLLDAFARALPHLEQPGVSGPPLLVLAGQRGWLSDAIEQRVAEHDLGELVRFPGYVPDGDLNALLTGATAFLFPSLYEGFGMPVLEAMACGAPVLTSTSSALPEVAGDAALLVNPTATEAMAAGIVQLVQDAPLRSSLRERGFARAATFTWQATAQATQQILLECI